MVALSSLHKSTIGRAYLVPTAFGLLSRSAPPVAVRVAERLFTTPHRSRRPGREHAWAAGARPWSIPSPHGQLSGWVWGAGPDTVLLVHGWSGRGLQLGGFAGPLVRAGYRVVAYDGPGHGSSPGRTASLLDLADGVVAAAAASGPLAGIVAHSLGASASLLAASRHGVTADALAFIAPPARTSEMTDWFRMLSGFTPAVVARMRHRLERRLCFRWSDLEPLRLVEQVPAPLLVIHDRQDNEIPHTGGTELARRHPRGHIHSTDGLGHRRVLRDRAVIDRVAAFLVHNAPFAATDRPATAA
jgi:pimeloyl-ACP methyl ester carboxylesterase